MPSRIIIFLLLSILPRFDNGVCPGEVVTPEDVTTRKGDGGIIAVPRDAFLLETLFDDILEL